MGAVTADDAEHGPARAMALVATSTDAANSTARVYLADHAFSFQMQGVVGLFHDPDKLVADRSVKACVTAGYLEIGIADAGEGDADESFAFSGWACDISKQDFAVFDPQSF